MIGERLTTRRVVVLIAGLLLGFAVLTVLVMGGHTQGFDSAILTTFRTADGTGIGPSWLPKTVQDWSAMGSAHIVVPVTIVATGALAIAKRPRLAAMMIACLVGTGVIVNVLKVIFERVRPAMVTHLDAASGWSFPSGHTTTSTAFYATVGFLIAAAVHDARLKRYIYGMAAAIPLGVGWTRVYLGVHFPTDVIGGWMLGMAWALTLGLLNHWLQRRGAVEDDRGDLSHD